MSRTGRTQLNRLQTSAKIGNCPVTGRLQDELVKQTGSGLAIEGNQADLWPLREERPEIVSDRVADCAVGTALALAVL